MYTLGWGTSKSVVALGILDVAPTVVEKGVALKVCETGALISPLCARRDEAMKLTLDLSLL